MTRAFRMLAATTLALLLSAATAPAQYAYPAGYGGYGWGGWGGGHTAQGDIARGMGAFAAGAGVYNANTAAARNMNAQTALMWNQYWYEAQQESNRKYIAKMAAEKAENLQARKDIYNRLRDNPNAVDINRGDALNVILDELNNPKVYVRGLKSASIKFPGDLIRQIPFNYASGAVTATVHSLTTKGSAPAILKTEPYRPDMEKLRAIGAKIREQDEKGGKIDSDTLEQARTVLAALRTKVEANLAPGTRERNDAERFIKACIGLSKMLETPAINVLLSGVENHPETTVGDLLAFMKAFNLRFGVADQPAQRAAYNELYPLLAKLSDEAFPDQKPIGPVDEQALDPSRTTDFFNGMEMKEVAKKTTPPPPPPAGRP